MEDPKNPPEEKDYKPSNKRIDDIFHRIIANMPIPGGVNDHGDRRMFEREWDILEKRISDYYLDKRILNKELNKYEKSKNTKI